MTTDVTAAPAETTTPAAPVAALVADRKAPPPLWRNWRFQTLWVGSSAAMLGLGVADFAYPLVILAITGSPAMASVFAAIQMTASLLSGLPAGALVDRFDRRRVLIGAEAGRALVVATVAYAAIQHELTVVHLLVVAAVLGAVSPLGGSARMLMVRAVVPKTQLTQALTQEEVRTAGVGLAGSPLGGVLLAAGRALPFVACAATFLLSLIAAVVVRPPRAEAAATTSDKGGTDDGGMLRGLKELWRDRTIRLTLTMISLLNVSGFALFLSVVVLLRNAGESPRGIGIAVAGEAVGTLIGAALVGRLHRLMGPGKLLVAVSAWLTAMLPLLAVPLGAWWVFGVIAVAMLGIPSLRVLLDVLILRQVPDERRGRTIAAVMTVITVGAPIGTMVAGLSLQFLSPVTTILGICALQVVALAPLVADARLRAAAWPAS